MFRNTCLILSTLFIISQSATSKTPDIDALHRQMQALSSALELAKPGLGEIMSGIRVHHEKLYFAGENENWALADYEIGEIEENLDRGTKLNTKIENVQQPLTELRHMTDASFEAVRKAIQKKDKAAFKVEFSNLTQACNACHQAAQHPFIRIIVPKTLTITNQDFSK